MTEFKSQMNMTPKEAKEKFDSLIVPPQRADGNLRIDQFYDLLYYVLSIEQPNVFLAPAFPRYLIPETEAYKRTMDNPTEHFLDTITYKVTEERPGSVGGSKQPFGDQRELVPRPRGNVIEGHMDVSIKGQWFDTLVQFDVWSLTNRQAESLVLWFKRFMLNYRDFFKHRGLSEILFWWRGEDDVTTKLRNSLHSRSIAYFVRTEELVTVKHKVLEEIEYKLDHIGEGG